MNRFQLSWLKVLAYSAGFLGLIVTFTAVIDGSYSYANKTAKPKKKKGHSQALKGPLKGSGVKVVKVKYRPGKGAEGSREPQDDYPPALKNRPKDAVVDQWRMYNRECTSWVAWALYSRNGFNIPFHDDAKNWGPRASRLGYPVNSTPAVGSVRGRMPGSMDMWPT